LSYGRT